jgi:hypothetical protein
MDILGRVTTRAASALRAAALAGAALIVSGCAVFSPLQTQYDYQAADGPALDTGDVQLHDLVVVAKEKGGEGVLVGQAVNRAKQAVEVSFAVGEGTPAKHTVPATSGDTLSQGASAVVLTGVPGGPGEVVELTVTTPGSGENVVVVPVVAPTGYYAQFASG